MKKLLIDLDRCSRCDECRAHCDYFYHPDGHHGYVRCMALATQELVCRRCDDPPCVKACPRTALEKRPDGMLNRYSMRCTSCKTCTTACPFGVIVPEIVEYHTTMCDLCAGRSSDTKAPVCVASCPHGALQWTDAAAAPEKDIHEVRGGKFLAHAVIWKK